MLWMEVMAMMPFGETKAMIILMVQRVMMKFTVKRAMTHYWAILVMTTSQLDWVLT